MKKTLIFVSTIALFFACGGEQSESSYKKCPTTPCKKSEVIGSVKDVDGNAYEIVKIGNTEWFSSDLKTTKLNDGTAISNLPCEKAWSEATEPAYATYNNEENAAVLYNYSAVESQKLCPEGWTVPNDTEWLQLAAVYAGMESAEDWGKVETTIGWDSTSFAATTNGFRESNGKFYNEGELGLWWSATPHNEANAMYVLVRNISKSETKKYVGINKSHIGRSKGLSVRCVRAFNENNTFAPTPEPIAVETITCEAEVAVEE